MIPYDDVGPFITVTHVPRTAPTSFVGDFIPLPPLSTPFPTPHGHDPFTHRVQFCSLRFPLLHFRLLWFTHSCPLSPHCCLVLPGCTALCHARVCTHTRYPALTSATILVGPLPRTPTLLTTHTALHAAFHALFIPPHRRTHRYCLDSRWFTTCTAAAFDYIPFTTAHIHTTASARYLLRMDLCLHALLPFIHTTPHALPTRTTLPRLRSIVRPVR